MASITTKGRKPPRSVDAYTPFWESDVKEMLGESCFFVDKLDGNGARAKLAFIPTEVNRVYQPYTGTTLVEGVDYEVDLVNGYITKPAGSSILDLDREELRVAKDDGNGDQYAKITATGSGQTDIYQTVLTVGHTYTISGKGGGDGSIAPVISEPGFQNIWNDQDSGIGWQYFSETFTAQSTTIHFGMTTPSAGKYVRFNNIVLEDSLNPGVNILTDGDMEAVGFGDWSSTGSPTLAKENDIFNADRLSSVNFARLTTTASGDSSFYEDILSTGTEYRITGYARSGDGVAAPVVSLPTESTLWTGTTSTDPQKFDVTVTPSSITELHFGLVSAAGAGEIVEFDLLWCEENASPGTNLLTDGSCDASDFTDWSSVNSPTLAKIAIPTTGATNHLANIYSEDEPILQNYFEVDYTHTGTQWTSRGGPSISDGSQGLPLFFNKLYSQQSIKIAYMGDSITTGASSSGKVGVAPLGKNWTEHFEDKLTNQYNATISSQNFAVGGAGSDHGVTVASNVISYSPDVVFIAYGVNDAAALRSKSTYKGFQEANIAALRAGLPNAEIILVSPIVASTDWAYWGATVDRYTDYLAALYEIQTANPTFISVVDQTSIWIELFNVDETVGYTGKDFLSVCSNNINHPADWGHKVLCQCILSSLRIK